MNTALRTRPSSAARLCILALLVLAGASLLAAIAAPARAQDDGDRSYRIADVRIDADLQPSGDLDWVEERTFAYQGTFRGAFYQLPLRGIEAVRDFSLSDSMGVTYREGDVDAEEPGTYAITSDDPFEVTWFYGEPATDTERTFTLSYLLEGVGQRHADASQLYIQWVGRGWDVPTDRVVAEVSLPDAAGPLVAGENLQIFAHGPLTASVEEVEPGVVRTQAEGLPPNTFLELRALMPPEALPEVASDGRDVRERLLEKERCLAIAADADRARSRGEEPVEDCDPNAARNQILTGGLAGLLALGVGGWGLLFARHGREYALQPDLAPAEFAPPSNDPPALVEWLRRWGSVGDRAFVATLMDLARQGVLELRREFRTLDGMDSDDADEVLQIRMLRAPDRGDEIGAGVVRLLRRAGRMRDEVTDLELEDWVAEHREEAYEWWGDWTQTVDEAGRARRWIESKRWMAASIALGIVLVCAAVPAWIFGARWWIAVPVLVAGIAIVAASPLLRRRTPEGRALHERWKRFGDFLNQASRAPEETSEALARWGGVLPYAVVLGLADEVVWALDARLSPEQLRTASGGWYPVSYYGYGYPHGDDGRDRGDRPVSMTPGLAALSGLPVATMASNPASSGAGGGASGGGGGGAGGSGGGAF